MSTDDTNNENHQQSNGTTTPPILPVTRRHFEQEQLNNELHYCKPKHNIYQDLLPKPSNFSFVQCLLSVFPILQWLPKYSLKRDLMADIVAGCTVAIMHIPQGMGYALLGNVPPIVGIYMAFFPVLIYVILGTSRHNSMGTFAVVSIMVGKVVQQYATPEVLPSPNNSTTTDDPISTGVTSYTPVEVATTICFVVGIIHLVMYTFRLGIITSLLSDTLVSGFTTGAAIHVLTSQIKDLFGLTIPKAPGNFEVIMTFVNIFKNISNINWVATGLSASTIVLLALNNEVLKPRLAKKCSFPVPIELILVLGGTFVSKYLYLQTDYAIKTLGNIPTGFPEIQVPRTDLIGQVFVDSIPIAMVSYTVAISMAIIFAQKMNYEVNPNQELLAVGAGNVFGSFFSCMPISASLSRSIIQANVGGKTQVTALISCGLLAIVLLWVGPFFEPLPRCVLAGIIVVSLKGMLTQVKQFFTFWKLSRLDALVWIVTFLAVVIVAIDIGLLVGIALSLACIFIRGMKPYTCLLGHVPRTDLYLDIKRYKAAIEIPNIKIFHYCGSINFASRDSFKSELCSLLGIDLAKEIKRYTKLTSQNMKYDSLTFKCLILDFSALSYIDPSGVISLKSLIKEFQKLSVIVYIAGCSCPVYEIMKKCDLRESDDGKFKLFPTVHDAAHHAIDMLLPISIVNLKESA